MGQYQPATHPQLLEELAIQFQNPDLIAEKAVPPIDISSQEFVYPRFAMREAFQATDARVAPTGTPNSRRYSVKLEKGWTEDFALSTEFAVSDKDDPSRVAVSEADSVSFLAADLKLGRELRMAQELFDATKYGASNTAAISNPWSDPTNSKPIEDFQEAIAACLMKPNKAIFGYKAWDAFRRHPDIIKLLRGTGSVVRGLAQPEEIMKYFDLDEILVGGGRYDATFSAPDPTLNRVWDDSKVLVGRILDAPAERDVTLARYYRYKPEGESGLYVHMEIDNKKGTRGVVYVKLSCMEKVMMTEPRVGFLMTGAVA